MRSTSLFAVSVCALTAAAAGAQWAPDWQIHRLGLTDAEHTSSEGLRRSQTRTFDAYIATIWGWSDRFEGVGNSINRSAWVWTQSGGSIRYGLTDPQHTGSLGARDSTVLTINSNGVVLGWSSQYSASNNMTGRSIWMHRAGIGYTRLHLLDALHSSPAGTQNSSSTGFWRGSNVIGESTSYSSSSTGTSAWLWTPSSGTERIGLYDTEHTSTAGLSRNQLTANNSDEFLVGNASRFSGNQVFGSSAWVRQLDGTTLAVGFLTGNYISSSGERRSIATSSSANNYVLGESTWFSPSSSDFMRHSWVWNAASGTQRIGLTDALHTSSTGFQSTSNVLMNKSDGQIIGNSYLYQGNDVLGQSAWTWTSATGTVRIGLTDSQHTRSDGALNSSAQQMYGQGRVIGTSLRYSATANAGTSAWIWTPQTGTVDISLADSEHTGADGVRESTPVQINASRVSGIASRMSAGFGQSAWTWTPSSGTVRLGLTDAIHQRADGWMISDLRVSTEHAVIGTSTRYSDMSVIGTSGWYYDGLTGLTSSLIFSIASDGRAQTTPLRLLDDGTVVGQYLFYDASDNALDRVFVWSLSRGFSDLGSLPQGGLTQAGWSALTTLQSATSTSWILGNGTRLTDGESAFVMTIPSPHSVSALSLLMLAHFRRRR